MTTTLTELKFSVIVNSVCKFHVISIEAVPSLLLQGAGPISCEKLLPGITTELLLLSCG